MKSNEEVDKCSECEHVLTDEDYVTAFEDRGEFWGEPCKEEIVIGYKCVCCGNREDY